MFDMQGFFHVRNKAIDDLNLIVIGNEWEIVDSDNELDGQLRACQLTPYS